MKIECVLRREGGTKADIDGTEYHFEPLADGSHVAEIENDEHADRFLAIPEAYKVYRGKDTPKGEPKAVSVKAAALAPAESEPTKLPLAGSEQHPPQFDIAGTVYTQKDIVLKAFEASGLSSDEWNELGEDERAAKLDIVLDELAEAADAGVVQPVTPPAKAPAKPKTAAKAKK